MEAVGNLNDSSVRLLVQLSDLDAAYTLVTVYVNCDAVGKEYLDVALRDILSNNDTIVSPAWAISA